MPSQLGTFWKDQNSRYMGCNDVAAEKSEQKSRHDIIDKTDFDLYTLTIAEANAIRAGDQTVINTNQPHCFLPEQLHQYDRRWLIYKWLHRLKFPVLSLHSILKI